MMSFSLLGLKPQAQAQAQPNRIQAPVRGFGGGGGGGMISPMLNKFAGKVGNAGNQFSRPGGFSKAMRPNINKPRLNSMSNARAIQQQQINPIPPPNTQVGPPPRMARRKMGLF